MILAARTGCAGPWVPWIMLVWGIWSIVGPQILAPLVARVSRDHPSWFTPGFAESQFRLRPRGSCRGRASQRSRDRVVDHRQPAPGRGRDGGRLDADVLVIDEAGMVGTRQLARVLDLARADGTKVVLVGDHRQLPEINAGGAFAALGEELGAITLRQNRRQVEKWERSALAALRDGDPGRAVDAYLAAGRVRIADNSADIYDAMVAEWAHPELAATTSSCSPAGARRSTP